MSTKTQTLEQRGINTVRILAIDNVQNGKFCARDQVMEEYDFTVENVVKKSKGIAFIKYEFN
jgi:hypothetical protein